MRCKHENADHLGPDDSRFSGWARVEQLRCIDCGAWLPLGLAAPTTYREMGLAKDLAAYHATPFIEGRVADYYVQWWANREDLTS